MSILKNWIALVAGASRGVGKGVALGLGEAGATVYVTGRTVIPGNGPMGLPGTIRETADDVNRLGGTGIPVLCDHSDDSQVVALFEQIDREHGRIDMLVNSVWGGYEHMVENNEFTWAYPFWMQPVRRWDAMFSAGVRAHYVASMLAARRMVKQGSGLIINISFWAAQKRMGNVAYGVAKAATDRMTLYMAEELKPHGVAVVCIYPGLVRTESVMRAAEFMDLSNSESPQFIGRAVAALASDPDIMKRTGTVCVAASLGLEYGFKDIDGRQPVPLSIEDV
ncbi:MAG TPA: SDR family NAD(P)-dependent oxidoreductase [Candidatus Sumerlaeota bacterium]|nr:SDR family NAD(P)-dependent oxidoreductase [Candidatus Sumerlaeota bacterium]